GGWQGPGGNQAENERATVAAPAGEAADGLRDRRHAAPAIGPVDPPRFASARRTRRRMARRASASTTWNSIPAGWAITSPRCGTRPASEATRPATVSID